MVGIFPLHLKKCLAGVLDCLADSTLVWHVFFQRAEPAIANSTDSVRAKFLTILVIMDRSQVSQYQPGKSNTFCYFSSKDPLILLELHLFCHLLQPPPNPIEVHKGDINFHLQLHLEQNNNKQVFPHMLHLPRVAVMLIDMLFLTVLWQLLLPMGSDLLPILVMHNQLKVK